MSTCEATEKSIAFEHASALYYADVKSNGEMIVIVSEDGTVPRWCTVQDAAM